MKRLTSVAAKSILALLLASGLLATNLQAQDDAIIVKVPFSFTAGRQRIAPGTYLFSLLSDQFLLSITNEKTGDMEVFEVHPERQSTLEKRGHLTFQRSGDCRALNEVHFPGRETFSELILRYPSQKTATMKASASDPVGVARR